MKKWYQTSEAWVAIITNLVGASVALGLVGAEEGQEIGNALKAIAGAMISLTTTLGYIKGRTDIKRARAEATHKGATPQALSDAGV